MIMLAFVWLITVTSFAQDCTISAEDEVKLLKLPYEQFDQSFNSGWRVYGNRECYLLAATILDRYNTKQKDLLLDWQIRSVTWHAGQMYAFEYDYKTAKERFKASFDRKEPSNTLILWNDYVYATLAFLDKDLKELTLRRDHISNGPEFNGVKENLIVVDALIKCIDKPYSVAYSGCRSFQKLGT